MNLNFPKEGQVVGMGCDIVEVKRVQDIAERQGDRFLDRVFTQEERDYCAKMKNPYPHLAARFAAKEAVSKAFTTGIGEHLNWKSISVRNGERSQPLVRLDQKGESLLYRVGGNAVHISLSHTDNFAMAVAAVVK